MFIPAQEISQSRLAKGEILALLGDKAFGFTSFLLSDDPEAIVINKMWDSVDAMDITNALFLQLKSILLLKGIINAADNTRIDDLILELNQNS